MNSPGSPVVRQTDRWILPHGEARPSVRPLRRGITIGPHNDNKRRG